MHCENCEKEHDSSYGSGRFCSCKCARGFSTKAKRQEINKKVSHELYNFIYTNKIDILGEPLPNEKEQKEINWDKDEKFDFVFDIAVAPEFEVSLSKKDKVKLYDIEPGEELISKYVEGYQKQFGSLIEKDTVSENDMLKGDFTDNLENGIEKKDGSFLVNTLKTKNAQNIFIGKKKGETIEFAIKDVFKNDTDLKSMFHKLTSLQYC